MTGSTKKSDTSAAAESRETGMSAAAQEQVSKQLRALYDSVQNEGIPDHFMELLDRLDQAEKAAQSSGD